MMHYYIYAGDINEKTISWYKPYLLEECFIYINGKLSNLK